MKQTPSIIIIGAIILIFGIGYLITPPTSTSQSLTTTTSDEASRVTEPNKPVATIVTDTSLSADKSGFIPVVGDTTTTSGIYTTYSPDAIAQSKADHILLFFKASWCPSCRALDADILAHVADIPAGVEIYTVDYDTAIALKRQYKITTQHSIIEIKADGTAISGITHGLTLSDVLSTLN